MKIATFFVLLMVPTAQAFDTSDNSVLNPKFERALKDEAKFISEIKKGILEIQKKNATEEKKLRGTHAKGICSEATFEVLKTDQQLTKGIYQFPGSYEAFVRFANGEGKIQSDWKPDVRSLSVRVSLPESMENGLFQDYSTNNTESFTINSVKEFANLFTMKNPFLLFKVFWRAYFDTRKWDGEPLQAVTFYSGTAFAHGEDHAVKYFFKPCATNSSNELDKKNPNALQDELRRHLTDDDEPACYNLWLQFLDEEKMNKKSAIDWVENASLIWPLDKTANFHVATLTLKKGTIDNSDRCEKLSMNVNENSFYEQRGLGNVNRGRTRTEKASAKRRLKSSI